MFSIRCLSLTKCHCYSTAINYYYYYYPPPPRPAPSGKKYRRIRIMPIQRYSFGRSRLKIRQSQSSVVVAGSVVSPSPGTTVSAAPWSKYTWCLTSTETIRLIRDGEKGGRGYGGGGRRRLYTYRYTVTTRMIPALRWVAMRAILTFQ